MKALGKGSIASLLGVFLTIAGIVLWVALVGVVLGAVGYAIFMGLVATGVIPPDMLDGGQGTIRQGDATINYNIDSSNDFAWPVVTPALAAAFIAVGGWLVIVNRLKKLCDSFSTAQPFRRENADHLRMIWITLLVIEVSRYALLLFTMVVMSLFGAHLQATAEYDFNVDLTTWGAIVILIVLAEVFREGAKLREEQDLTI